MRSTGGTPYATQRFCSTLMPTWEAIWTPKNYINNYLIVKLMLDFLGQAGYFLRNPKKLLTLGFKYGIIKL